MNGNDITAIVFRPKLSDISMALGLLSRFPVPAAFFPTDTTRPAAYAAWAYPLVGLLAGGISLAMLLAALHLGLPAAISAILAVLANIIFTGAMHEDGLADCADGFWGGWTAERRLEIMKDSQIGTYGVLALLTSVALKAAALCAIMGQSLWMEGIICAAIASRAAMVSVMFALPNVRTSGLSGRTGRPPRTAILLAVGIGIAAILLAMPSVAVSLILVSALATCAAACIARTKIGGQTGDVLGATQQIVEVAVLLTCVAVLAP